MFTPGSSNKFLFATLGGRLLEVGDYSNRGYYSNKYSICVMDSKAMININKFNCEE